MGLEKVISGAQTGVDRAALDAVMYHRIYRWGGWVPKGRLAENGEIPEHYFNPEKAGCGLRECDSSRPAKRTVLNILEADATMILRFSGGGRVLSPGTKLTIKMCREKGKAYRIFDPTKTYSVPRAAQWICEQKIVDGEDERGIKILNIAGPRESKFPGIYEASLTYLRDVIGFVSTYELWGIKIWAPRKPKRSVGI